MPRIYGTDGQISTGEKGVILLQNSKASGWQEIQPGPAETTNIKKCWIDGGSDSRTPQHRSASAIYSGDHDGDYESLRIKNVVTMPLETRESPLELMVADGTLPVLKEGRYDIRKPFPEQKK